MATRIVPFTGGMKIGLGYNRLSGDRLPTPAIQGTSISSLQGASGQQVTIDCTTIQDVETLHKSLGISIDAGGAYMGFSGSAKVDYANHVDIQNRQDVLEDLAKKRFKFLALRDGLKYILKHSDDFQNAGGTSVDRTNLSKEFDDVVNAINTMQQEASVCTRDAKQCEFTKFEVAKISLPTLAKGTEDVLVARGEVAVNQDPLAVVLRASLPDALSRRGFNIAFGDGGLDPAPGPGKDKIRDSLIEAERGGYNTAGSSFLDRNRNLDFATKGAAIAKVAPKVAAARTLRRDAFYSLGFDIATGIFGVHHHCQGGARSNLKGLGDALVVAPFSKAA